jgi:hypothetical protein
MNMNNTLNQLMEKNLLEERDSARRKIAINAIYTEDCTFFETNEEIVGRDSLNAKVESLLKWAPGFVFRAAGPAEVNHDVGRLRWHLGPPWSSARCHRHGHCLVPEGTYPLVVHLS